ncbi:hypothetical protein [Streptomyces boluensis]|uniref:Uncharacterized protein n=1 Tax=Streptomyces boluensis TaxID=1775135 RepID=A0A964XLQ4_9ACTN|nr:hypothetical protein [Streptomyces boluensis]NBE51982.1 hypothetical protein [Streptomyces boluensis]
MSVFGDYGQLPPEWVERCTACDEPVSYVSAPEDKSQPKSVCRNESCGLGRPIERPAPRIPNPPPKAPLPKQGRARGVPNAMDRYRRP